MTKIFRRAQIPTIFLKSQITKKFPSDPKSLQNFSEHLFKSQITKKEERLLFRGVNPKLKGALPPRGGHLPPCRHCPFISLEGILHLGGELTHRGDSSITVSHDIYV